MESLHGFKIVKKKTNKKKRTFSAILKTKSVYIIAENAQNMITTTVESSEDLFCTVSTTTLMHKHLVQRSCVQHNIYK